MSDVDNLIKENHQLKDQLQNQSKGVEGLLAQLDACKQTINENMNTNLMLRTHINIKDKEIKSLNDNLAVVKSEIENVRKQLIEATKPSIQGEQNAAN